VIKCPYCGSEINAAVAACSVCGHPQPQGAVSLDYRGIRFALGRTVDSRFAVWDQSTGAAVAITPSTDAGWQQAWGRYMQLEHDPGSLHPAPVVASNGMASASMILGILGSILGLIPLLAIFALALGGVGLFLGFAGLGRAKDIGVGRGAAIAGIVLSIAALGLAIAGFMVLAKAARDLRDAFS
jgi:hypothetical protein